MPMLPAYKSVKEAYDALKDYPESMIEPTIERIKAEVRSNPDVDLNVIRYQLEALEAIKNEKGDNLVFAEKRNNNIVTTSAETRTDDAVASKEYRSAWLHHLQGAPMSIQERMAFVNVNGPETRADAFASTTNSGSVVPTITLDAILQKARDVHNILGIVRQFSVPAGLSVPVGNSGSAFWHQQGARVEAEDANLDEPVVFGGHELMRIISMSAALDTMSISALESYIVDELVSSAFAKLGESVINGSGVDEPMGILNGITWDATNSIEVADNAFNWRDITAILGKLKSAYSSHAAIAVNNSTFWSQICTLADDNNRPLWTASIQEGTPSHLLGKPVIVDDAIEDNVILVGDFEKYGVNLIPNSFTTEVSRDSSFRSGLIDLRILGLADGKPLITEAFAKLTIQ